jgi:hypothetical protein
MALAASSNLRSVLIFTTLTKIAATSVKTQNHLLSSKILDRRLEHLVTSCNFKSSSTVFFRVSNIVQGVNIV